MARSGRILATVAVVCLALAVAGCGGKKKGGSSSGGGTTVNSNGIELTHAPLGTPIVGPNLNGNAWSGTFETEGYREAIQAVVRHTGNSVTIQTTRQSGIGREFVGTTTSSGELELKDTFDYQTWTTLSRNATSRDIRIYDYTFDGTSRGKTNIIRLTQ